MFHTITGRWEFAPFDNALTLPPGAPSSVLRYLTGGDSLLSAARRGVFYSYEVPFGVPLTLLVDRSKFLHYKIITTG